MLKALKNTENRFKRTEHVRLENNVQCWFLYLIFIYLLFCCGERFNRLANNGFYFFGFKRFCIFWDFDNVTNRRRHLESENFYWHARCGFFDQFAIPVLHHANAAIGIAIDADDIIATQGAILHDCRCNRAFAFINVRLNNRTCSE